MAAVCRGFLRWLDAQDDELPPVPERFLDDPAAELAGQPIGLEELERAVRRLQDEDLLGGMKVEERVLPVRARLTPEGRACVQDVDGDVEVWRRERRGGADQRVIISGAHAQVAAYSSHVTQVQTLAAVEVDGLRVVARALLAGELTELPLDGAQRAELRADAEQVLAELGHAEPDQTRLAQLRDQLRSTLSTVAMSTTAGILVQLLAPGLPGHH